jgi:signal transduction histidine kinase
MSSPRWYRSLYWRIALGLCAFLALMLTAQGALFLWMTDRIAGSMPARSPLRLASLVASDLGARLSTDATLDLEGYLREEYGDVLQTFVVLMRDGRTVSNHDDVPPALLDAVRAELAFMEARGLRRQGQRGPGPRPRNEGNEARARGTIERPQGSPNAQAMRAARRPGQFAQIVVNQAPVGRVLVLPGRPSFLQILRRLGPTIAPVAAGILGVGMIAIAFVVFGPARRRLKDVQTATERLGSGDWNIRVPDRGGDEVAAVARSFNRMAEELASRAQALEASDKARRQLLADVSHELMTPLTAMRGYIETLAMPELRLDEATRTRYLGIVTEETHRLERIIGDLLDLARLEGGGTAFGRQAVDVEALFERVAARHERELHARGVHLVRRVAPDAGTLTGDPDRLEQALQNLAANALRHTPEGGTIELDSSRRGDALLLTVRDTGPGVAPEHLASIFDRFYKADAARRATGNGSGLGLSIVKAIVERHGGRITVRNDGGAVFEIALSPEP